MPRVFDHQWMDVVEGGECAFCDNPIPYFHEDTPVPRFQILVEGGAPWLLCESCWQTAHRGAPQDDVNVQSGVCTIYSHA